MNPSTFNERLTAAISTVVAIALLGAALSAQQAQAPTADQLASLEADLRLQLDFASRQDGAAHRKHVAALEDALAAWRESAQSAGDHELLIAWMQTAIRQTMPGRAGELPPTPPFSEIPPPIAAVATTPVADDEPAPTPVEAPEPAPAVELSTESPLELETGDSVVDAPETPPVAVPYAGDAIADEPATDQLSDAAATVAAVFDEPSAPEPPAEHSITVAPAVEPAPPADDATEPAPAPEPADVAPTPSESVDDVPPAVTVNLAELDARIAGYHEGLSHVEAALVAEGEPAPEQLATLVAQLEQLAVQYQFVRLYYDALTDDEQLRAVAPRTMSDAVDQVAARVAAATAGDLLQDFDAAHDDEPTLGQRLEALAAAGRGADAPQ